MADDLLRAIRQQVEGDQILGVKEIPISREKSSRVGSLQTPRQRSVPVEGNSANLPRQDAGRNESHGEVCDAKDIPLKTLDETQVKTCRKCHLHETRTKTVFGQGNSNARLVFVGEAPGYDEDQSGLAFVGRAGQLLTKMIDAMGLTRDDVYICNVLKCRPPNNRTPAADEIASCSPYLYEQLRTINPQIVCALGAPAAQTLLNTKESIGRLRGRFHEFYPSGSPMEGPSIPLMATYHPAYLLRSPHEKRKAWEDLQLIMQKMDLPLSDAKT